MPSLAGVPPNGTGANTIIEWEYNWVFRNQHINTSTFNSPKGCAAAMGANNPACFFPENALAHTKTPTFVLNSGYDSWQTNFIWFTPDGGKPRDAGWHACAQTIATCNTSQLAVLDEYHANFVHKLQPMTDLTTPHGGYVESCMANCQSGSIQPPLQKRTSLKAIAQWYDGATTKLVDVSYPNGVKGCAGCRAAKSAARGVSSDWPSSVAPSCPTRLSIRL